MRAIPRLDLDAETAGRRPRLKEIKGIVPALTREIAGCAFAPRCEIKTGRCEAERPELADAGQTHHAACHEWQRAPEAVA
jgi:peptide/nickel transport system ATP-binding protein